MKILPVINTDKNITHKGELTFVTEFVCNSQIGLCKIEHFRTKSSPEKISLPGKILRCFEGFSFDLNYLDIACKKIFKGKSVEEKKQIRDNYRTQAEENYKQLTELMKRLFSERCFLHIKKFKTDKKFHAIINNVDYRYFHDFGEMNLSRNNNDLRDIDVMTELVNKIKNLTKQEIDAINKMFEPPVKEEKENHVDIGGVICGLIAGGL